jgi:hypothetical protein
LTLEEIQSGIFVFNVQAQEDRELAAAIAFINATLDKKDSAALLTALKLPGAKLANVREEQQVYYMTVLAAAKGNKKEVRTG